MKVKAFTRFLYANVPGLAAARFGLKDLTAPYFTKPEFRGVAHFSTRNGLIVDVGANRGQSIEALRKFAPHSSIAAFEPEPRLVTYLQSRYRRNPTVTIHGCALSTSSGTISFFVPKYGLWNCDGMSATDDKAATDWLNDSGRMSFFNEKRLSVEEHVVERRALDSFGLAPWLIKLHAQGAEFDILQGAHTTIKRHQPVLMAAFPTEEVNNLLGIGSTDHMTIGTDFLNPGLPDSRAPSLGS